MTANRRAELQRKLAVAPVEKPPAGLATRIKNEIPKELRFNAEGERKRFAQSVRISMAVAASVIVVIATAYLGLRVTSTNTPIESAKPVAAARDREIPPAKDIAQAPAVVPQVIAEQKKDLQIAEHRARKQQAPAQHAIAAAPPPPPAAEAPTFAKEVAAADESRNAVAESITVAASAPAIAPMAPANQPKIEQKTEATRSPISGRVMVVSGGVLDAAAQAQAPAREEALKKWKDVSAEAKIQILKDELARGAEPGEVARVAREAGLNEFADSIEKKQQH